MKKRIFVVALLIASLVAPVFAAQVTVEWNWAKNDPAVEFFRYQLDGEDENGWEIVDSSVTSYTVSGLDGSKEYTLYLQQSYDGIYWSESASSTSEAAVPEVAQLDQPVVTEETTEAPAEEPVAVEETPVVVEETPVVVEEEPAAGVEEPVSIEPVAPVSVPKSAPDSSVIFSLMGGMGLNNLGDELVYNYDAGLQLSFEDIAANSFMGWDIKLNAGAIATLAGYDIADTTFDNLFDLDNYSKSLYFDLLTGVNFRAGITQIYLDAGARLRMDYGQQQAENLFDFSRFYCNVQPTAVLGFRFNMGWFDIALEGQYVWDIQNETHDITPRLMFGFRF